MVTESQRGRGGGGDGDEAPAAAEAATSYVLSTLTRNPK
jgi:hypothetical protein